MAFNYPYGDTQQLNLNWFLAQWETFREQWATAEEGIDHALDAEIARVEAAMTDLYAARDAAAASKTAAQTAATNAASSETVATQQATLAQSYANTAQTQAGIATAAAEAAGNSASSASNSASNANLSKVQAGNSATAAGQSATLANDKATAAGLSAAQAGVSATNAAGSAEDSEAWAVGERGGSPVASGDDTYENNSKYYADQAATVAASIPADYTELSDDVSELKTAITDITETGFNKIDGEFKPIYLAQSTGKIASNSGYMTKVYTAKNGCKYKVSSGGNRLVFGFYDSLDVNTLPKNGLYIADNSNPSTVHEIENTVNGTYLIVHFNAAFDSQINATVYEEIATERRIDELEKQLTEIESDPFNWAKLGTFFLPFGWRTGYYNTSGAYQSDAKYLCTPSPKFSPDDSVSHFYVKAPTGYSIAVFEYNDFTFVKRHGNMNTTQSDATNSLTIQHTAGHRYSFCVGRFANSDAESYITSEFVNSIVLKTYSSVTLDDSEKRHLNILILGNSYSADSWAFAPFILKKYGITCNIHFYYRGSGSFSRLVAEWNDSTENGTDDWEISHPRRYVHIDTRYQNTWETAGPDKHPSPKQVVEIANTNVNVGEWDIITIQQNPAEGYFTAAPGSPDPRQGVEPYVRKIVDLIKASYTKPYNLALFGTYTRWVDYDGDVSAGYPAVSSQTLDNRVGTLKSTETTYYAEPFNMMIPVGTAIFNARTNSSLASTNVSPISNLWAADALHLQAGIPEYIATCTVVQSIFNKFYPELSILGDDTRITDSMITDYVCPFINNWAGSVLSSDETLYELAQKCAITACNQPFDITPIYLPTDTTELELFDTHSDRYWADALITQPSA